MIALFDMAACFAVAHVLGENFFVSDKHMKHENRAVTKNPPMYAHVVIIRCQHILKRSDLYSNLRHLVCG